MSKRDAVLIRMMPGVKAWLEYRAQTENRSMNAEILSILAEAMKSDPLLVFVHEANILDSPKVFTVTLGARGRDLIETPDREEAIAKARAMITELGLPKGALAVNVVADNKGKEA